MGRPALRVKAPPGDFWICADICVNKRPETTTTMCTFSRFPTPEKACARMPWNVHNQPHRQAKVLVMVTNVTTTIRCYDATT